MIKVLKPQLVVVVVLSGSLFVGCGSGAGGGSGGNSSPPGLASIEVKPNSTTLAVDDSGKQFSAEPKDAAGNIINGEEIFWEIVNNDGQKGAVNATGWYRPPTVLPDSSNVALVKAFSRKDPNKSGFASINLLTGSNLTFGTNVRVSLLGSGVDRTESITDRSIAVFDKNVYAVWADADQTGNHNIYFAMSTDRGRTFSAPQRVNNVTEGQQLSPKISVDLQGNIYVVWYDSRPDDGGPDFDIYFAKGTLTNGTVNFSNNVPVNDDISGNNNHFNPAISVDASGNVYIAWEDSRENAQVFDIYFAKGVPGSNGGITFLVNQRVNDVGGVTKNGYPNIAVDAQGKIYVTWVDFDHYRIYIDKGIDNTSGPVNFQNDVQVTDAQSILPLFPSLAIFKNNVYVAWEDFRNPDLIQNQGADIYIAMSENNGDSFGLNRNVSNALYDQYSPSLSVDLGGNLYLAWEDYRNVQRDGVGNPLDNNRDIYFAKSDGGVNFGIPIRVNSDTGTAAQSTPTLALDSAGRAFLLWFDERDTTPALYFAMGQ